MAGQPTSPLNREHQYDNRGLLTHISNGAGDARHFVYDEANRLSEELGVYPSQYQYDPAGNRLPQVRSSASFELHERSPVHPPLLDNRLREDETFIYRHDVYGNLVEKRCHANDSEVHRYGYDSKHRLSHYAHTLSWSDGHGTTQGEYIYDPLGRRVGKRILHLSPQGIPREEACLTWYGWDGDRLVLTESDGQRVHTLYQPGSFIPLLRIEGDEPPVVQTLVQTLEQDTGIHFEPEVADQLHRLEGELRAGTLSTHSQQWLNHAQLNQEQLQALLKPLPERETPLVHLYHCDHLGTPLALINQQGDVAWQAEFDAWGNQVAGRNAQRLYQPIRMQGQHYDEETGLHYNRHRYYDPMLGRYINQDPIGLRGGGNLYMYPLDPLLKIDPLGLSGLDALGSWLSQPGMRDAYNNAVTQYESLIPKPISDWKFTGWDVNKGSKYGNSWVNVNAKCKDQFDNIKSVDARYFQTGWFPINEVQPGRGIPDPGEASSDIGTVTDSIKGLVDAHSRAVTCGSKSGYECFMDYEATPELGEKLCGQ